MLNGERKRMNWEAVGAIGEIIGAIGVIATLGYLAIQVRHNSESMLSASELGLSERSADWMSHMTTSAELTALYDRAADEPDSLTAMERVRFKWLIGELFMIFEGYFQLYSKGRLAEDSWRDKSQSIYGLLQNPIIADWWEMRLTPFSSEFVNHINANRSDFDDSWQHVGEEGIARRSAT